MIIIALVRSEEEGRKRRRSSLIDVASFFRHECPLQIHSGCKPLPIAAELPKSLVKIASRSTLVSKRPNSTPSSRSPSSIRPNPLLPPPWSSQTDPSASRAAQREEQLGTRWLARRTRSTIRAVDRDATKWTQEESQCTDLLSHP